MYRLWLKFSNLDAVLKENLTFKDVEKTFHPLTFYYLESRTITYYTISNFSTNSLVLEIQVQKFLFVHTCNRIGGQIF